VGRRTHRAPAHSTYKDKDGYERRLGNGRCGIGIARLATVLSGRDTIRDVILFPLLRERD
jgi:aspartyl/asparaginyl-tRNA synthetase